MQLQRLLSFARKAVDEYSLIQEGDHIAVGISGGKDSLTLLYALHGLKRFYPQKFELSAVTVDLGFYDFDLTPVKELCGEMEIPYRIVKSDIYQILFDIRKESNPCSLCSKMRRGALNTKCVELGYNKLALGHNADDLTETFFLSMVYEGRLNTFQPVSYMSRTGMTVIRPLIYVKEADIKGAMNKLRLTPLPNPCPANHNTEREHMKNILDGLQKEIPIAKDRIFSAITSPERYSLLPPKKSKQ